jgi:hypothetical protein
MFRDELKPWAPQPDEEKKKRRPMLVLILVVLFLSTLLIVVLVSITLRNLGVFDFGSGVASSKGFSNLRPLASEPRLGEAGGFKSVFINDAGLEVEVIDAVLEDINSNKSCPLRIQGRTVIPSDGKFILLGSGCRLGTTGEFFKAVIRINYQTKKGGRVLNYTEAGVVSGIIE